MVLRVIQTECKGVIRYLALLNPLVVDLVRVRLDQLPVAMVVRAVEAETEPLVEMAIPQQPLHLKVTMVVLVNHLQFQVWLEAVAVLLLLGQMVLLVVMVAMEIHLLFQV